MIPLELLKKVRQLEIRTRRTVQNLLAGQYHSAFKGQGVEFDEVREYQPGDEVRSIDWNVTARAGRPYVKTFVEERELTIVLLVDVSPSERFGSGAQEKAELAAEFGALVAFSALRNQDKVGLALFTDRVEKYLPPKKGRRTALRLIRELLSFKPQSRGTDIARALDFIGKVQRRRAVVFLVSDFLSPDFEQALARVGLRHDLIAVRVGDPAERSFPPLGLVGLEDAETGTILEVDTASARVRDRFAQSGSESLQAQDSLLRFLQVDTLDVTTGRPYLRDLQALFKRRERKMYR